MHFIHGILSFLLLLFCQRFARLFFRLEIHWVNGQKPCWEDISIFLFLNHTSLFEPLFMGALPVSFMWRYGRNYIAPGADITLNRPIVGLFYKLFSPNMISVSRKRDLTWENFLGQMKKSSLVAIAAEGRMMRPNGLDRDGKPMTIRGGVADILKEIHHGKMLIAYSGGLHHVQKPGEWKIHFFKTIKMNFEVLDIKTYKAKFSPQHFKREILIDLEDRKKRNCPK